MSLAPAHPSCELSMRCGQNWAERLARSGPSGIRLGTARERSPCGAELARRSAVGGRGTGRALVHLGRAISDAPDAQYPAQRLAMIALESFSDASVRPGLAAATKRALLRALDDAPTHVELAEALAGFELRMGRPRQAELHLQAAIELSPKRPALYLLLAQALRAQRDIRGALVFIDIGLGLDRDNTMLRAGRSAAQALLAAKAGATFISPFVGRLDDVGHDGMALIADIVQIYRNYPAIKPRCWSPACAAPCT